MVWVGAWRDRPQRAVRSAQLVARHRTHPGRKSVVARWIESVAAHHPSDRASGRGQCRRRMREAATKGRSAARTFTLGRHAITRSIHGVRSLTMTTSHGSPPGERRKARAGKEQRFAANAAPRIAPQRGMVQRREPRIRHGWVDRRRAAFGSHEGRARRRVRKAKRARSAPAALTLSESCSSGACGHPSSAARHARSHAEPTHGTSSPQRR